MSIGIMDADMAEYTLVPFNLEVMKISAYYKKKGELVVLSPSFTPQRHQKFFYRKDYDDGIYPAGLTKQGNVEYGGLAFSNNVYKPLPLEMERVVPDAEIYAKMEKAILNMPGAAQEKKKIFQNMITAEHCRLSLDGKTIWPEYSCQFSNLYKARNLMFHDFDLGAVDGSFEEVQKILARARNDGWATRVGMKFPVQISTGQELLNWSSLRTNSTFYSLKYVGVIDDEPFMEWIKRCHEKAVYIQMEYMVTAPSYEENHFLEHLLPKILRQIIISRTYRIYFSLKYDEDFFTDKRWCRVLQMFNFFHSSFMGLSESGFYHLVNEDTLFNFASNLMKTPYSTYGGESITKAEARELFAFVREKNYPLFKDFYECSARSLGGQL